MAETRFFLRILLLLTLLVWGGSARAILQIEITEGVEGGIPIAVVPFGWSGTEPPESDVAAIISADLARSGRFSLAAREAFREFPRHGGEVHFENWRAIGVENLVVGRVLPGPDGGYQVQFQLFDIYRQGDGTAGDASRIKQLAGYNLPTPRGGLRRAAHTIADLIYETLTGEPGAFNTRMAYITAVGQGEARRYALRVADADGYDPVTVVESPEPLMSPAWSPDGRQLAYVSFEGKRAAIYLQELATGERRLVSQRPGINGAPAWSPDGRRLALTLSEAGDPEIYILELATGRLTRLTHNTAIDTEPVWMPDGRSLLFTSDRSGAPQIYRIPVEGGRARRITFEGGYNAAADVSPDGKRIAMVHRTEAGYRIAVMELESGLLRVVSQGRLDESPSFAPNGAMILYATEHGGRGVLAAVSSDGSASQRLVLQEGDVREPAWGPLPRH